MATEGFVKFEYFSKGVPPYYGNSSFPELLDDESIVVKTPNIEMSYHQYFGLFKKFLMSVGFSEKNIIQGACSLAFNEMNDEKTMREVAEEYDLTMNENIPEIIADSKKQDEEWIKKTSDNWEQRYWALYRKMQEVETVKYTDDELDAMCDKAASDQEKEKCREYNLREAEYYNKRAQLDVQANSPYNDGWTQQAYKDELEKLEDPEYLKKDRNSNFPGENTICDANDPSNECKEHWNDFWEEDNSNNNMWEQGMLKVTTNDPMKAWNGLVPGSPEAQEVGCICPVLDNEEMPDDKKWIDVECSIHGRKK